MKSIKEEQQSVSKQIDMIMTNRERRFEFLMKKDRVEDAVAIGEEFTEWMMDLENEEILYYKEDELTQAFE